MSLNRNFIRVEGLLIFLLLINFIVMIGCESFQSYIAAYSDHAPAGGDEEESQNGSPRRNRNTQAQPTGQIRPPTVQSIPPEAIDHFVRLVLSERSGSFALYYLADPQTMTYEPLFNSKNSSTTFMTVNVDGKNYHLGRSTAFRTSIQSLNGHPAIVFESPFLTVNQVFTPIRTPNSLTANGVMISITAQNISDSPSAVGMRFLIDTILGEGRDNIPFLTENHVVTGELLLRGSSEKYWISRGQRMSLMGSIAAPAGYNTITPDFIHMANWKRLNDVPWRLRYSEGRSFNKSPASIRDTAVCYYYEPLLLERGQSITYTIFLSTEDISWYNPPQQESARASHTPPFIDIQALKERSAEVSRTDHHPETIIFLRLYDLLEQFISGEISLNEQELTEIERFIDRHRN